MLYEDVEVVVLKRILTCETAVIEVVTARVNEVLKDFGSPYQVADVYLHDYPREIEVLAEDSDNRPPDENDLGLSYEGCDKMRELFDELAELTGANWVSFPGYYYSK